MRFKIDPTIKQAKEMIRALIKSMKGEKVDCYDLSIKFRAWYGLNVDHHEYAYILDAMHREGKVELVQPGGTTVYRVL